MIVLVLLLRWSYYCVGPTTQLALLLCRSYYCVGLIITDVVIVSMVFCGDFVGTMKQEKEKKESVQFQGTIKTMLCWTA